MLPTLKKVFAYITRGDKLLVFRHADFPEAGIQVPAGTAKEGEGLDRLSYGKRTKKRVLRG